MQMTLNDAQMLRSDLLEENVNRLKAIFPEAFTEGKIDFEVLKELLGGQVDIREEKYGLNWNGKRDARRLAFTPSTGTLHDHHLTLVEKLVASDRLAKEIRP